MLALVAAVLFIVRHKRSQLVVNVMLIYGLLVLISTVLFRSRLGAEYTAMTVNLDLLGTWRERFLDRASGLVELIINFCMLFPVGFLFSMTRNGNFLKAILTGLSITVGIELLQLVTFRGFFEVTDIIDNVVGVAIGFGFGKLCRFLWRKLSDAVSRK